MKQKLNFDLEKNSIVCGDCCNERGKGWLNFIPDNSIDLIYIDPPFFSNKNYEIVWGNGFEERSFGDRWKGGIAHYIKWMKPKIKEAKRVLTNTGSIFFHCDWHASHRLRCLLDEVFDEKKFRNEIIWHYGERMMGRSNFFDRKHDSILFYSKGKNKFYGYREEYSLDEIRSWRGTKFDKNGEYTLRDGGKGKPRYKAYVKDIQKKGRAVSDVWDIKILGSASKERIGYKTQKPKALLERIIHCASKENDLILDFFGGGGTTAEVCADLNRKFIIGDVSPVAVRLTADRLSAHGYRNYEIKALPSINHNSLFFSPTF